MTPEELQRILARTGHMAEVLVYIALAVAALGLFVAARRHR